jgi:hypothetical protein
VKQKGLTKNKDGLYISKAMQLKAWFNYYSQMETYDKKAKIFQACKMSQRGMVHIYMGDLNGTVGAQKTTAFKWIVSEVFSFYNKHPNRKDRELTIPLNFNELRKNLLGYFDEVSHKSGMISDYAKLTRCALVLSFDDDLEEPYHIHMLKPHVQVGEC